MRKYLFLPLALLASTISMAQTAPEPANPNAPAQAADAKSQNPAVSSATALPSGTVLPVDLSKSLDAKKSKEGDKIEAKTSTDMLEHGQIVVPRNTKIIGHVTQAKARTKESPDSTLGISFDRMLLKDGREVPLQFVVQAVARPLQVSGMSGTSVDNPSGTSSGLPAQRPAMGGSSPSVGGGGGYPGASDPGLDSMASNGATSAPLGPTSRGVVGMKGLSLDAAGPAAVLSSNTANVHLDTGTQLILRVQ